VVTQLESFRHIQPSTNVVASHVRGNETVNNVQSDFLFAAPTFISGAARVLDLYGVFDKYNTSSSALEADSKAILSDWSMVGQDLFWAMHQFEISLPPESIARHNELCGVGQQMSFFP
jgi:hypothetical protein